MTAIQNARGPITAETRQTDAHRRALRGRRCNRTPILLALLLGLTAAPTLGEIPDDLILGPGFDLGTGDWTVEPVSTAMIEWDRDLRDFAPGALRLTNTMPGGPFGVQVVSDCFDLVPGEELHASVSIRDEEAPHECRAHIAMYEEPGCLVQATGTGTGGPPLEPPPPGWRSVSFSTFSTPPNLPAARLTLILASTNQS